MKPVGTDQAVRRGGAVPAQDPEQGVFAISVAADIVGTNIANLRTYERRGLLEPARTEGGTRLYSQADLERLTRIVELLEAGVNLAGIAMVLDLEDDIAELRRRRRT
jgi:DNA-binding transcriptional MerR regulator